MSANGEAKRLKKRRGRATALEVKAFKRGMEVAREAIGPEIWKRAAIRAGGIGLVIGLCTGSAIMHYLG